MVQKIRKPFGNENHSSFCVIRSIFSEGGNWISVLNHGDLIPPGINTGAGYYPKKYIQCITLPCLLFPVKHFCMTVIDIIKATLNAFEIAAFAASLMCWKKLNTAHTNGFLLPGIYCLLQSLPASLPYIRSDTGAKNDNVWLHCNTGRISVLYLDILYWIQKQNK